MAQTVLYAQQFWMASHAQLPTCMALKFVKAIASPRYAYECLYGRSAVAWLYSHKVERRSKDKVQAVWSWCNLKHAQAECYCWTLVVLCCRFQIWVKRKDKQHRFLWKSLLCSEHVWVCVNRNGRGKLNVCLPVCVSFNWVGRKEGRKEGMRLFVNILYE